MWHEPDRDPRPSERDRLSARKAVREDDPLGRARLDDLAQDLDAVGIADVDRSSRTRVNRRTRAPPVRPPAAIGEVFEHEVARRLDDDGAIKTMRQRGHTVRTFRL